MSGNNQIGDAIIHADGDALSGRVVLGIYDQQNHLLEIDDSATVPLNLTPMPTGHVLYNGAAATGGVTFNHESWGVGGDILWGLFLIGAFWACFAYWWR